MEGLWRRFDRIVVFDTETTGIEPGKDRIIELGAVSLEAGAETGSLDALVRLPEGVRLSPFIVELTGITDEQLLAEGVDQREAAEDFCRLLEGCERPLLVAYNAQFDLNFLYHFLRPCGRADVLRLPRFLDALTVYRDRRDYPHKLCNAIEAYGLGDTAVNSHRAIDDARAAALLGQALSAPAVCYISEACTRLSDAPAGWDLVSRAWRSDAFWQPARRCNMERRAPMRNSCGGRSFCPAASPGAAAKRPRSAWKRSFAWTCRRGACPWRWFSTGAPQWPSCCCRPKAPTGTWSA